MFLGIKNKIIKIIKDASYKKVKKAELNWWKIKGVTRGKKHYPLYEKIFQFNRFDFTNKVLTDVGAGMYPIHLEFNARRKILIDPLVNEYNKISGFLQDQSVEYYESFKEVEHGDEGLSDVIFCFNCIDHVEDPALLIEEIHNNLKKSGVLFIYSHIGNPLGGPSHPHNLSKSDYYQLFDQGFKIVEEFSWNDEQWQQISRFPAFIAIFSKI